MTAREAVAKSLIAFEGIDSHHPLDRGGLTHYGLTLTAFQAYKPGMTWADLAALSFEQVVDIITEVYALRPGFWKIADHWVMWAVIDCAINSGPAEATTQLQRALQVQVDGVFGRHTEYAVNHSNPERLFRLVCAQRIQRYAEIVAANPSQVMFLRGWMRRATEILEAA